MARAELLAAVEALRLRRKATQQVVIWTDRTFVIFGSARGRRREHLSHADFWEDFWKAHDVIGPSVLFHKVWRSHATEAEIAAGLTSPLEAHGDEAADKLAARGVKTTPQMTRFRDAKVCNNWLQMKIDDHRIQSDYKCVSGLQNPEGKNSTLGIASAW